MPVTRITSTGQQLQATDTYACLCTGDLDQGFTDGVPNVPVMDVSLPAVADMTDGDVVRVQRQGGWQAARVFPDDGDVIDGRDYVNLTREGECQTLICLDDGGTKRWFLHRLDI